MVDEVHAQVILPLFLEAVLDAQVLLKWSIWGVEQHLTAHAEMCDECVSRAERKPHELAPAFGADNTLTAEQADEVSASSIMTFEGSRIVHAHLGQRRPNDSGG